MPRLDNLTVVPKVKGVADIVFCIDITGSMGPCIVGVLDNLKHLAEGFGAANVSLDWKAKAVGYRDVDASGTPFEGFDNPFTSNIDDLKAQFDRFEASGGGDEPESLFDAMLKIATAGDWPHPVGAALRTIVVFTDASPHGQLSASLWTGDLSFNRVSSELRKAHTKLFLNAPEHPNYNSFSALLGGDCRYSSLGTTRTEVLSKLQTQGFDQLLLSLGKTVSAMSVATATATI